MKSLSNEAFFVPGISLLWVSLLIPVLLRTLSISLMVTGCCDKEIDQRHSSKISLLNLCVHN